MALATLDRDVHLGNRCRRLNDRPGRWRRAGGFISASLAAFAGFAVLGLTTAVVPAFLGVLGVTSEAVVGLVVFAVFAASAAGQVLLQVVPRGAALPVGCLGPIAGMAALAVGLAVSSLALLIQGAMSAGIGQGLSFRAGLTGVNEASPPEHRAEVARGLAVSRRRGGLQAPSGPSTKWKYGPTNGIRPPRIPAIRMTSPANLVVTWRYIRCLLLVRKA